MPIVSAWVMPAGILAMLALPFGFDGIFWRIMGDGIDWMIAVALWVASLPGAVGRIPAFGVGPLLLGSAGLVLLCLLRSPLRWSGAAAAALACVWVALTPVPDAYIAHDGQIAGVRNAQGALSIVKTRNDDFTVKEWLAADADKRPPRDPTLQDGTACDGSGCIARVRDGAAVALSKHPASLEEDCLRAAVVVTPRSAPAVCGALVIDRDLSRAGGAIALYRKGDAFEIVRARPQGQNRPWVRTAAEDAAVRQQVRPSSRDATPRTEDLEADD
jgi:competence protein ComEC